MNIFVIVSYGGEYDDAWERIEFAVRSEQEAEQEVQRLTETHKELTKLYKELNQVLNNFEPSQIPYTSFPDRPKGPARSSKEGMEALEIARNIWAIKCRPIEKANELASKEWHRNRVEKLQQKIAEMQLTEEQIKLLKIKDDRISFYEDVAYRYEAVDLR